MHKKLTLSIDPQVAEAAKAYAREQGRSLSNVVEEYLKSIAQTSPTDDAAHLSKIVKDLKGSVTLPEGTSYEELLEDALLSKYLK